MSDIVRSLWSETAKLPHFEPLQEDIRTDVLIIGGGMAGLLCAYMLEQSGIPYVLAEADRICGGITKNSTAKITMQHRLIYHKIMEKYGSGKAEMYLDANKWAMEAYRSLCQNIDCDYEEKDSFVYSLQDRRILEKELDAINKIGFQAEFAEKLPLPFPVAGAVCFRDQAEFHPLKFAAAIAKNLNIYEHTQVKELLPHMAVTDRGKIMAENIIVATHFPMINKHGSYFLKMYQDRSYVIALKNAQDVKGMYVDEANVGMSFRNYQDLLLIGGGSHRTGKQGGGWSELETFAAAAYPKACEQYRWATQDCITLDGIPYIGQYSARTPGFYVASGFNKWGMTSSMVAAKILSDMVLGKKNPYGEVFSPSRSMLHPQLALNAFEATANLLTISGKRCPHLGCALKWNPQEKSWDCPCHGSRFTEDGKRIDNPAAGDLKKEK